MLAWEGPWCKHWVEIISEGKFLFRYRWIFTILLSGSKKRVGLIFYGIFLNKEAQINKYYGAYGPQGMKLVNQISKKIQVKNCLLFSYSKVYQWQYNEAMQFVLWVAQKTDLQAWRAFSIFKFTKLKSYDKNNIYLYLISFIQH